MINCSVTEVKGMIHISVYGHSGTKGESLSCAGASTLFGTIMNSLEDIDEYVCESGYGYLRFPATPENQVMTRMFKKGMELLKNKFPEEFNI